MRNHKYRAWDRKNKVMLEIQAVDFDNGVCIAKLRDKRLRLDFWNYDVDLMQSTEIKDKNGIDIFEGDIIKGKEWSEGKSFRHIGIVTYVGSGYRSVGVKQYYGYRGDVNGVYEVIGNIYDNPEMVD